MSRLVRRCLTALFVLFVVGGIGFGASQAFGSARLTYYCGDNPEDLGCCPPYDQVSCVESCWDLGYYFGGACLSTDVGDPCDHCCTCIEM